MKKLHALEISLTIGCKLDCLYCPQKLLLNKYYGENKERKRALSFENFKVALDKVQAGASISFCGMSEPFHNLECADMICYAYEKGYKISLLTTLVGMSREDFEKIKDIKFDSFVLHIPDEERHSKFVIDDEYLDLLKLVNEKIDINYYSCHGSVHSKVKPFIDKEKYAGISLGDRAGNLEVEVKSEVSKSGAIVCYHGSESKIGGWTPVMFPDGSLVLCCQDYGMKHVLGNLLKQSWSEICEGEEYQKFICGLKDDSIDILCRQCGDSRLVQDLPSMQLKKCVLAKKEHSELNEYSEEVTGLIDKFVQAETVCVFGLGKLFRDHFWQEYWNEGLGVSVFSDNNRELWGSKIKGIQCVPPEKLKNYHDMLVVIFVKDAKGVVEDLQKLGIDNFVFIDDVFDICGNLSDKAFIKITN